MSGAPLVNYLGRPAIITLTPHNEELIHTSDAVHLGLGISGHYCVTRVHSLSCQGRACPLILRHREPDILTKRNTPFALVSVNTANFVDISFSKNAIQPKSVSCCLL